jgi:hypothetical protein
MTDAPVTIEKTVKLPRVLVAVVLDQDTAAVYWRDLEAMLRAQECALLWDLLVVDVSEDQAPNYAQWLADLVHQWTYCRVRRLSMPERGIRQTFTSRELQFARGQDKAYECYCRWKSYVALWLLRCDARPVPTDLQRLWDAKQLIVDRQVEAPTELYDFGRDPKLAAKAVERILGPSREV